MIMACRDNSEPATGLPVGTTKAAGSVDSSGRFSIGNGGLTITILENAVLGADQVLAMDVNSKANRHR